MNSPTEAPLPLTAAMANDCGAYYPFKDGTYEALRAIAEGRVTVVPRITREALLNELYSRDLRAGCDRNWTELATCIIAALRSLGVEVES